MVNLACQSVVPEDKRRELEAVLGQWLQQSFGCLLTAKCHHTEVLACCRRSYLHLENCKDEPIWKRSWLKGPSKATFPFPKDVDINRTVPENEQAEMKYKCKQRARLLEEIKVSLCLSPHRVSQTQQCQFLLYPAGPALVTGSEAGHSPFVWNCSAIVLPRFRLTWTVIIEQKCTFLWPHYRREAVPTLLILSIHTRSWRESQGTHSRAAPWASCQPFVLTSRGLQPSYLLL